MSSEGRWPAFTVLASIAGFAAAAACSSDVDKTPAGTGGGGGAGATSTSVSEAHGGCYDTFQCGDLFGEFGCLECESDGCQAEVDACHAEPECQAYIDCAKTCSGDHACIDGCALDHTQGAGLVHAIAGCTACKPSCLSFDCPHVTYPPVVCPP